MSTNFPFFLLVWHIFFILFVLYLSIVSTRCCSGDASTHNLNESVIKKKIFFWKNGGGGVKEGKKWPKYNIWSTYGWKFQIFFAQIRFNKSAKHIFYLIIFVLKKLLSQPGSPVNLIRTKSIKFQLARSFFSHTFAVVCCHIARARL